MIPAPFFDAMTRNYTIEHGVMPRTHAREVNASERAIGAFKLPPFQRTAVWTALQKVRFIESIWLHLPIASYVVNRDDKHEDGYPCDDWLLDGQQRWTAIIDYVNDRLRVFDLLFGELPLPKRRKFMNHPFPCIETRNLTPDKCLDVYNRLAYGGTNHAPSGPTAGR
jgi:uncharacterized protein with ParB-like and HNH nuclease domain